MRLWCLFATFLITLVSAGLSKTQDAPCIIDPARMPASWQPSDEIRQTLGAAPWSATEAADAEQAKRTAVADMIAYFNRYPSAIVNLWDDSVEALIQVTYASANSTAFDAKVREAAVLNLTTLITSHLENNPQTAQCGDFADLLPLAIFAHRLYASDNPYIEKITNRTNAAYRACGSLSAATVDVMDKALTGQARGGREDTQSVRTLEELEDLFDLTLWSIWLTEAQLFPEIELPSEARAFAPAAWKHLEAVRLVGAKQFPNEARNEIFITIADLATHIAHVPTGVHRFRLYVDDLPHLHSFHRQNFYSVMQSGDFDLFASFLDTLRQYGCTPENDVQVRDGTRYLLKVFRENRDRWIPRNGDRTAGAGASDYDTIHRPWTAALGLRDRKPRPAAPGTYGGIIRRWLPQGNN